MGGKGGNVDTLQSSKSKCLDNLTLREKVTGKTKRKTAHVDTNDILKIQHMQNIALWSTNEASIHSLGMIFAHRLVAFCDSVEFPLDLSLLFCKRCGCISQLDSHCNSKTDANTRNTKKHKGKTPSVKKKMFFCNDCSSKEVNRKKKKRKSKKKSLLQIKSTDFVTPMSIVPNETSSVDVFVDPTPETSNLSIDDFYLVKHAEVMSSLPPVSIASETFINGVMPELYTLMGNNISDTFSPAKMMETNTLITATSSEKVEVPILERKKKKRKKKKSKSKKVVDSECGSPIVSTVSPIITSRKRKRKSWTSLKDKQESIRHDKIQSISNAKSEGLDSIRMNYSNTEDDERGDQSDT